MYRFVPIIANLCIVAWTLYNLFGRSYWVIVPLSLACGVSLGKAIFDIELEFIIWRNTRSFIAKEEESR